MDYKLSDKRGVPLEGTELAVDGKGVIFKNELYIVHSEVKIG